VQSVADILSCKASISASCEPIRSIILSGKACEGHQEAVHLRDQALQRRDVCHRFEIDRGLAVVNGKKVRSTFPMWHLVTASIVFERLGLKPNLVYMDSRISMEMLKKGEIDAVIAVGGKPTSRSAHSRDDRDRFHFVPVGLASRCRATICLRR